MKMRDSGWFYLTSALALGTASAASAQMSSVSDGERIEDIVVTAQKREQTVQTVPIAMSAVTANDLERRSATNITDIVTKEVAAGGAVTLPGLGKFACRARPARLVRNPSTGEQMKKPADRVAKVTIAKQLKDVINASARARDGPRPAWPVSPAAGGRRPSAQLTSERPRRKSR